MSASAPTYCPDLRKGASGARPPLSSQARSPDVNITSYIMTPTKQTPGTRPRPLPSPPRAPQAQKNATYLPPQRPPILIATSKRLGRAEGRDCTTGGVEIPNIISLTH